MLGQEGAYQGYLNESCSTIAEVLHPAGYRTLLSGKWHVGGDVKIDELHLFDPARPGPPITPLERGFDEFWGLHGGAADYYRPRILMDGFDLIDVDDPAFYLTDAITDHAVEMIDRAVADESPFFLLLSYTASALASPCARGGHRPLRADVSGRLGPHPCRAS